MIAILTIFISSMIIALSGALMPGPLLTVTINESTKRGAVAGPLLIGGHAILELGLLIGLLLGLGPFLQNDVFFITIALVGGSVMFWMAWGMFKSLPTLTINANETAERKNNLIFSGIVMSVANPYWIIWWATIGIGYIFQAQKLGMIGLIAFYVGHISGDLLWYTAISVAISKGKKLFTDKIYRMLIAICGSFLVGFAIYLLVSGVMKI